MKQIIVTGLGTLEGINFKVGEKVYAITNLPENTKDGKYMAMGNLTCKEHPDGMKFELFTFRLIKLDKKDENKDFMQVTIAGNLGKDIEYSFSKDDKPLAKTSIAANGSANGQKEMPTWFYLTLFGKNADNAAKYLSKGRNITAIGNLEPFTSDKGRTFLNVSVSSVFYGAKPKDGETTEVQKEDIPI